MVQKGGIGCRTCDHPERPQIDQDLAIGTSAAEVARRYDLNRRGVTRHRNAHVSPALAVVAQTEHAKPLLARIESLVNRAEGIMATAEASGRPQLALSAVREVRESLKLLGQASGELKPDGATTVQVLNVQQDPGWLAIRTAILGALDRFPEAKVAVVDALTATDAPLRLEGPRRPGRGHAPAVVVSPYRPDDDEAADDDDD